MPRILLLVILLLVYGSLYPWDFYSRTLHASVPEILLRSWPGITRAMLRDLIVNVLIYMPLGAAALLSYRRRIGAAAGAILGIGTGLLLSTGIEVAQIFARPRTPSAFDICCNTAGTAIGVWLASMIRVQHPWLSMGKKAGKARAASGLLILWAAHQLYPLFPSFGFYRLAQRIRQAMGNRWTWTDVMMEAAAWIAVAILVRAVFGDRARWVFALSLLLAPARLGVVGSGPSPAHFLGAAIAAAVALPVLHRLTPPVGAALLIVSIAVRELMPFHFGPPNPSGFTWIPFGASLGSDQSAGLAVLVRKSFDYGAGVWMLWGSGAGWGGAALLVAGILAVGEAAQLWLPGRSPEITDPVLALLMAFVLRTLQRERARR
jgi:VanZ family protein